MHRSSVVAVFAMSVWLAGIVGCAGGSAPSAQPAPAAPDGPAAAAALDEAATAVRLQATVYEIRIAPERIGELDADRLAAVDFAKYPPELGEARALYVIDQHVKLAGEEITVGSQEPVVTNSRVNARGERINMMQYQSVGAVVAFKAQRTGPRQLQVTSNVELATKTDAPAEASPGVAAQATRRTTMSMNAPVELGKPTMLIGGDASSLDKEGRAVVYVARLVLGATGSD